MRGGEAIEVSGRLRKAWKSVAMDAGGAAEAEGRYRALSHKGTKGDAWK